MPFSKRNYKGGKRRLDSNAAKAGRGFSLPPRLCEYDAHMRVGRVLRFQQTTGGSYTITNKMLFGAAGVVSKTNVSCTAMFEAVKINRIQIWAVPSGANSITTIGVNWQGTDISSDKLVSDTSLSPSVAAYIDSRPPANSAAAFWADQAKEASTSFTLILPVSAVVIDLSLSLSLSELTPSVITTTSATAGQVYFLALDGPASNKITPVILQTTT